MAVLLVVPSLFYGLGWYLLVNGRAAPLNRLLNAAFDIQGSPFGSGWLTMSVVAIGFVMPIGYLFLIGPISQISAELDDAARASGATARYSFFSITLPLLRPTLFGVFVLMTSYGFSAFELPLLFGTPDHINVFSTQVYTTLTAQEAVPDYAGASSLALILMVLVILLVVSRSLLLGNRSFTTISGKGFKTAPRDYGRIQWLFSAVFIVIVLGLGVAPLVQMILGSLQPLFGVSNSWTTANYEAVLSDRDTSFLVWFTVALAAVAGFIAAFLALSISYLAARMGRTVKLAGALVTWAPVAIPGVLVGLALITAYLPIPGLRNLIGTPVMLLLGFVVVVAPIATRAVEGGVLQISTELEDAARTSGSSQYRTFFDVVLPILLPSFFAGWFIAGIGVAGNLSLPVLLSSPTMQTVPVKAYYLYQQGYASQAAALFLLLMGAVVVAAVSVWAVFFVIRYATKRRRTLRLARTTDK
jgi:iron(III) transport system permease protein